MRNKKLQKRLSLLVAVLMLVALFPATVALAADDLKVGVSEQKLMANGKPIEKAQVYNINDSNYFQLREIAALLKDTPAEFNVDFNTADRSVYIVQSDTSVYDMRGDELTKSASADVANTAVKSAWKIYINKMETTDIDVYNIDGSNYFKIRDLGNALHFNVDYVSADKTVLISTSEFDYLLNIARKNVFSASEDNTGDGTFKYSLTARSDDALELTTEWTSINSLKTTLIITRDSIKNGVYEANGAVTTSNGEAKGHAKVVAAQFPNIEIDSYNGNPSSQATFTNLMVRCIRQALQQLDSSKVFETFEADKIEGTTYGGGEVYGVESLHFSK